METPIRFSEDDLLRLFEASRAVASTLRLPELLATVMRLAGEVARAEASSLLLVDPATGELYFDVTLGEKGRALQPIRLKRGEGIAGWVAENRKPAIVNDVSRDSRWTQRTDQTTAFKTRNLLAVPMQVKDKLVGVMEVINRADGASFTEADARALEVFAAQAAVALESARLFESIRQEQEKLAMILAEMSEGALLLDAQARVIIANPAAHRLFGQRMLPGLSWGTVVEGFNVTPGWAAIEEASDVGKLDLVRRAPPLFFLAGAFRRIRADRGGKVGYLMIFRDVTEERREAQIKRNFLSLISHKLKTPLVALRGYAPMLLEDSETLTPFQKKSLTAIDRQSQQLAGLVEELIRFSALDMEAPDLSHQALSLGESTHAVLTDMEAFLKNRCAEVACEPSLGNLPQVAADGHWIKEALRALVENAVKFNDKPHPRVRIGGRSAGAKGVELFVADNGPGIPPEELGKLFQKFYQIEASFTGQVQGLGLGLALVKQVMNAHGGDVRVESVLGEGSTFTVSLPAA